MTHRGEKYPCTKCGKVLANRKMWSRHTKACVQGKEVACSACGKEYASTQGMKQHMKAKHGADIPEEGGYYVYPYCNKGFRVKKTWVEHKPYYSDNPGKKGPYYLEGCWLFCSRSPIHQDKELEPSHVQHAWLEGMMGLSTVNLAE